MVPSRTPQQTRHCIRYFMETPFVSLILDSSVSDVIRWCLTVRAEDVADWVADPVAPSPLPPRVHPRGPLRPVLSPPSAVDELCAPRHLKVASPALLWSWYLSFPGRVRLSAEPGG